MTKILDFRLQSIKKKNIKKELQEWYLKLNSGKMVMNERKMRILKIHETVGANIDILIIVMYCYME